MPPLIEIIPGLHQLPRLLSGSPFFVEHDGQVALIDGGIRGSHPSVLGALAALGKSPAVIDQLIATHTHLDHVGGFARLRRLSSARVAVHEAEARFMDGSTPYQNPFSHPLVAWLAAPFLVPITAPPVPVDRILKDGDRFDLLGGTEVVHTPGHTAGSISLYLPAHGVLIVGDAMEARCGRLSGPMGIFTADMAQAHASIKRISSLDVETLCFSHFPPMRGGVRQALRRLANSFD